MTPLSTIQSWPRAQLESAFTQHEDQLTKALEAEKLARAGFDKAAAERDAMRNALSWYGEIAEAIGRYSKTKNGQAIEAVIVELTNDKGSRFKQAMNNQDPQTAIDYNLYPSSARPSGLEVPQPELKAELPSVEHVQDIYRIYDLLEEVSNLKAQLTAFHNYNSPEEVATIVAERDRVIDQRTAHTQALKVAKDKLEFLRHEIDYGTSEELKRAASAIQPILATINNLLK